MFTEQRTKGEDLVDSALHGNILACVTNRFSLQEPVGTNTLVVVTGDGNEHTGLPGNNFPHCVDFAAAIGWNVEVWSWKYSRSRKYQELVEKWKNRVVLIDLDDYRPQITRFPNKLSSIGF